MPITLNKKIIAIVGGGIVGFSLLGSGIKYAYDQGVFESTAKIEAPWIEASITGDGSSKWYIDYTTVERTGDGIVTAWIMDNITKPQKNKIRSIKAKISFGCESNKYIVHTATSYSKQAGYGEILDTEGQGEVTDIIPGSVFSHVKTAACNFQDYKESQSRSNNSSSALKDPT